MTKIDIISGFLGAGKTTLIKKLLSEALKGEQVVLIENEFGQIGIDGGFLKEAGIEIKEMNSGCICCSLVGDFGASLKEVLEKYHPDRIVIEPSGVGKLSDVVKAVEGVLSEEVKLNSATAVVDASKCKMYLKNFGEFFANQIEHAGTIVLSRTGQMSEEKIEKSLALIREHNKEASVITTPWEQLEGARILEVMEKSEDFENDLLKAVMEEREHNHHHEHDENCTCGCHDHDHDHGHHDHDHDDHDHDHHGHDHNHDGHDHEHHHDHEHDENCTCGCHDHDHEHHHEHDHHEHDHHEHDENCTCGCHDHSHGHHHADEVFTSWGMETPRKYTEDELKDIMEKLEDKDAYGFVLRAKGIIASDGAEFFYFDYVPGESEIRKGTAEYIGKVCVIGSNLQEENLKNLFMA